MENRKEREAESEIQTRWNNIQTGITEKRH